MTKPRTDLSTFIRSIPDWPKPGILFYDITPLLGSPQAFPAAIEALVEPFRDMDIAYVAAVEARGFIFGSAVAERLRAGFIPIRKKGKLPYATESVSYALEYGTDTVEMHRDAVEPGAKVLMVDDLLATGGTMKAGCELVTKVGGVVVGTTFLIELKGLGGRDKLADYDIHTVMAY